MTSVTALFNQKMLKGWLNVFFSRLDCVYGVQSNLMLHKKTRKTKLLFKDVVLAI